MSNQEPGQQGPYQPYPGGQEPAQPANLAYPGGQSQMPGVPRPPLPPTVRYAYYFMLAGAVLSLVSTLLGLGSKGAMRTAVQKASPGFTPDQVNTAVNFGLVAVVAVGLIGVGLWIWMAFANKAGRNWARITGTVFFGLDTLTLISGLSKHNLVGLGITANALVWLVGLAAVLMMWNPASRPYYKPQAQYPAPQVPPYAGGGYPR